MCWPQTDALSLPLPTHSSQVLCFASDTGSMKQYLQPNQVAQVGWLFQDGTSIRAVERRFAVSARRAS